MLNKLLRLLFYWPIRLTSSCNSIPFEPLNEFTFDKNRPLCYLTMSSSVANLLSIERLTQRLGLPSPFSDLTINGKQLKRVVFLRRPSFFHSVSIKVNFEHLLREWVQAARAAGTDIQILPITVIWSRDPGIEGRPVWGFDKPHSSFQKFFRIIFSGNENCNIMSRPINLLEAAKRFNQRERPDFIRRAIEIHFRRQMVTVTGRPLPDRARLIEALLARPATREAIALEARTREGGEAAAEAAARDIFEHMVADARYWLIRTINRFISCLWRGFFHGQQIDGAAKVRALAQSGHEIIYVPCHRSHMDYVMMFFVIFHEGLPIPQVASGNNLDFFPAGGFIRRCGAYFIRRKMKGDNFYLALFREYLALMFERGYATEFFIEGGRSRTGRTLPPRTGMVAMTVQSQLRGIERPIAFVPTYLGYEHVMEIGSYMSELSGQKKKKESALALLGIFKRLRYYGRSYICFGEPLVVPRFLSRVQPEWHTDVGANTNPPWLHQAVDALAHEIIVNINDSAAVNGINLCALALMSEDTHIISMDLLKRCLRLYIKLLKCDPQRLKSIHEEDADQLVHQAIELRKMRVYDVGDHVKYVHPSDAQLVELTYFMNNIVHHFALPSLIANIILRNGHITRADINAHTRSLFYFLRHELFVPADEANLDRLIEVYVDTFVSEGYLVEKGGEVYISGDGTEEIILLTQCIRLNLLRYMVGVAALKRTADHTTTVPQLIERCVALAECLPHEVSGGSPEFHDPIVFRIMCDTFIRHQYFWVNDQDGTVKINPPKLEKLASAAEPLMRARDLRILYGTQVMEQGADLP
ncbi:MAG: glycerol-3-phosphate 1-O-acyltransferase PlsB [Succinivibrionaceae bacterium]|nr:glycerol-3-phosphate 1-O-acyltransferase PlsB [Succinivibrionaceae bacterium]